MKVPTKLKVLVVALAAVLLALIGVAVSVDVQDGQTRVTITYGEKKAAEVEEGVDVDAEAIQTVEEVDAHGPMDECPEGEECGRGALIPTVDISTPQAFANATLGGCWNVDGAYGAQCWDLMALYWYSYVGRSLSTCGTGAAKGTIKEGCWQLNAGTEFTMVWDPTQVQPGDVMVYGNGQWGHIGMAMGYYNNGYVTLLGQNQGGNTCNGGGAAANIINLSTKDFLGAFRPNIYKVKPEPQPVTPDSEEVKVKAGDTLGAILRAKGYTGKKLYGDNGLAERVAKENSIADRGLIYPGQIIYINPNWVKEY